MGDDQILRFDRVNKRSVAFPCHGFVSSWYFEMSETDEATLAHHMAKVAEKNGLSNNDMMHLFPYVLRMLRSDIAWANQKENMPSTQTAEERPTTD